MQITPMRGSGTTVLVVDDDALITLNIVDVLSEQGHTALEAFSGHEALAILEQYPHIGALITDFSMPGMSGVELAEAARALRPGLPVLLTSGYSELPEGAEGAYPRLDKPFREDELVERLSALLALDA